MRPGFAPNEYEICFIQALSGRGAEVVLNYDQFCGGCEIDSYFIVVNGRPDYLCLTCRLAS